MTTINIAFSATKNWFLYTMTSIASILKHADEIDYYNFFIMSSKFNDIDKANFRLLNKIKESNFHFIEMDDSEYKQFARNPLGNSTNYRLKLSSITTVDKILYLDSDVLVLSDIAELYNTNIDDYYIAAVEDKCSNNMKCRITDDEDFIFVNAGVVLMNLTQFRENNLEKKFFEYLIDKASFGFCDQDAINKICYKHIKYMPLKFNLMSADMLVQQYDKEKFEEAIKSPVIVHFVQKPWINNVRPFNFKSDWHDYYKLVMSLKPSEKQNNNPE